jgi:hypothetical protein
VLAGLHQELLVGKQIEPVEHDDHEVAQHRRVGDLGSLAV